MPSRGVDSLLVAAQQEALHEQQRRQEQDHDGHAMELGLDLHVQGRMIVRRC